jgi:ferredoxin, 2Fe-2S
MPKIRFLPDGRETDVSIGTSILEAARACGAEVGSACGGVCACSTCHVYVKEGFTALSEMDEREEDVLDKAFDVHASSRLGCRAKLLAEQTSLVEISRESQKAYREEHPAVKT